VITAERPIELDGALGIILNLLDPDVGCDRFEAGLVERGPDGVGVRIADPVCVLHTLEPRVIDPCEQFVERFVDRA